MIKSSAHVPAGVAVLQSPDKNLIQRRPGNNSEMAEPGHCLRKLPTGYARAHAALNDCRVITHILICLMPGASRL
jgi:hypothetical protein